MRNELEATKKEQPELLISQDHALGIRLVYTDQGVLDGRLCFVCSPRGLNVH